MRHPSASKTRRVVQWSSGACGAIAIGAIARRPDLELIGLWVHDPAKVGRDVGELAGGKPIGLRATHDAEALLALAPDCVCYTAIGESRPDECLADLCRILASGSNVVSTSVPGLIYPAAYDPAIVARLDAACQKGGSTLYMSGIEPGFAADHLVAMLTTGSNRIDRIRTQELFSYSDYPVAFTMFEFMGFGKPMDHVCLLEQPGVQTSIWGPPIRMVADTSWGSSSRPFERPTKSVRRFADSKSRRVRSKREAWAPCASKRSASSTDGTQSSSSTSIGWHAIWLPTGPMRSATGSIGS